MSVLKKIVTTSSTPTQGDPPGTFPNLGNDSPWESMYIAVSLCIDATNWFMGAFTIIPSLLKLHRAKTEPKQEDL